LNSQGRCDTSEHLRVWADKRNYKHSHLASMLQVTHGLLTTFITLLFIHLPLFFILHVKVATGEIMQWCVTVFFKLHFAYVNIVFRKGLVRWNPTPGTTICIKGMGKLNFFHQQQHNEYLSPTNILCDESCVDWLIDIRVILTFIFSSLCPELSQEFTSCCQTQRVVKKR